MTQPLNLGILGAGGIVALSHLPELTGVDGLRVTHMCGLEEDRLQLLCDRFSVPRYSMTWEELLGDDSLDAILVAPFDSSCARPVCAPSGDARSPICGRRPA